MPVELAASGGALRVHWQRGHRKGPRRVATPRVCASHPVPAARCRSLTRAERPTSAGHARRQLLLLPGLAASGLLLAKGSYAAVDEQWSITLTVEVADGAELPPLESAALYITLRQL